MCVCECVLAHLTGVVDEPGLIPRHGGVHHVIKVDPEHVASDALQQRSEGSMVYEGTGC